MRFNFYSPVAFEPWDWRNSVEKGIGGSETSHVEMAWRLARRGHEVVTYAPVPDDCPGTWRDTVWHPLDEVDWSRSGVWVLYRCPEKVLEFDVARADQVRWLMMQDWDYPWQPEYVEHLDRLMVLSQVHARWVVAQHPELAEKMFVTGNGVKGDLIEEVEALGVPFRNPFRVMYASSPDRGLKTLLQIFERAQEFVPELALYSFYGFDNIDKMGGYYQKEKAWILKRVEQNQAIHFQGRVPQRQLYREWLQTAILCYPSDFWETGFITGQEAQCLGAIPLTSSAWAQGEVCRHGVLIPGSAQGDALVQARYMGQLVRLASDHDWQAAIRAVMIPEARKRCDWENYVDQWIVEAERCCVER